MPDVPLRVERRDGELKLEPNSQRTLDAVMREGDFITLGPAIVVPADSPRVFGKLLIELRREEIGPRPDGYWDLRVIVRNEPEEEDDSSSMSSSQLPNVLLANTLTSVACTSPSLSIRVLEPTVVLVERECRVDDAGQVEVMLGAWICDSDRARCD